MSTKTTVLKEFRNVLDIFVGLVGGRGKMSRHNSAWKMCVDNLPVSRWRRPNSVSRFQWNSGDSELFRKDENVLNKVDGDV